LHGHTTTKRIALLWLAALAWTTASAASAVAQNARVAGGIALQPVGASKRLDFPARPGSVVQGAVLVKNTTAGDSTVRLTAVDVGTAAMGGAVYGDKAGKQTGRWLVLATQSVKVPAHRARVVRFRVRIPGGARPGVHYAGITAIDAAQLRAPRRSANQGKRIVLRRLTRFALPVKLRVPGAASPRLQLRGARIDVDAVGANVLVKLQNTGQTLIRSTKVDLRLKQQNRTLASSRQELREFVPDSSAEYSMSWPGIPAQGDYRLVGEIRPAGAPVVRVDRALRVGGTEVKKARRSIVARTAPPAGGPPVALLLGLGGALAVAVGFGIAFMRMRRRLKAATGDNRG
jgi:hypothetical protein